MRGLVICGLIGALGCSGTAVPARDAAPIGDAASVDAAIAQDAAIIPDAFIAPDAATPDDAAPPACILAPASGCASSEACRLTPTGVACSGVTTHPAEYQPCSSTTDCGSGMQCLGDLTEARCRRWCATNADCVRAADVCNVTTNVTTQDGGGTPVPVPAGFGICGAA